MEAEVGEKESGRPGRGVVGRAEVELCANHHTQMDGRKTGKGEGFVCKKDSEGGRGSSLGRRSSSLLVGGELEVTCL